MVHITPKKNIYTCISKKWFGSNFRGRKYIEHVNSEPTYCNFRGETQLDIVMMSSPENVGLIGRCRSRDKMLHVLIRHEGSTCIHSDA